jgi:hypothetical protein
VKNRYGLEPIWKEVARLDTTGSFECQGCNGTGNASYGECFACGGTGKREFSGEWVMMTDISVPEAFSIAEFFEDDGTI